MLDGFFFFQIGKTDLNSVKSWKFKTVKNSLEKRIKFSIKIIQWKSSCEMINWCFMEEAACCIRITWSSFIKQNKTNQTQKTEMLQLKRNIFLTVWSCEVLQETSRWQQRFIKLTGWSSAAQHDEEFRIRKHHQNLPWKHHRRWKQVLRADEEKRDWMKTISRTNEQLSDENNRERNAELQVSLRFKHLFGLMDRGFITWDFSLSASWFSSFLFLSLPEKPRTKNRSDKKTSLK